MILKLVWNKRYKSEIQNRRYLKKNESKNKNKNRKTNQKTDEYKMYVSGKFKIFGSMCYLLWALLLQSISVATGGSGHGGPYLGWYRLWNMRLPIEKYRI